MDGDFICEGSSLHAKLSVGKILNPTLLSEVFIRVRENLDIEKKGALVNEACCIKCCGCSRIVENDLFGDKINKGISFCYFRPIIATKHDIVIMKMQS